MMVTMREQSVARVHRSCVAPAGRRDTLSVQNILQVPNVRRAGALARHETQGVAIANVAIAKLS